MQRRRATGSPFRASSMAFSTMASWRACNSSSRKTVDLLGLPTGRPVGLPLTPRVHLPLETRLDELGDLDVIVCPFGSVAGAFVAPLPPATDPKGHTMTSK